MPEFLAPVAPLVWAVLIIAAAVAAAWFFRALLLAAAPAGVRRVVRTVPLTASFGMLMVFLYVFVAVFADVLAPFPEAAKVAGAYQPWNETQLLGTDQNGRDMLSRLIYGARNTVGIAFLTTLIAFGVGTTLGLLAATVGGWLDQLLSRFVDAVMAIPAMIFALVLLTVFGLSIWNMVLIIALIDSTRVFRLARSVAMNIVVMDYIEAARLRGEGMGRLIFREILPNAAPPLIAEFGLRFCFVFLMISALSFLGVGVQPPLADWGSMVKDSATLIAIPDWERRVMPLLPAGAIALLTVSVNFIVDWILHRASGLKE